MNRIAPATAGLVLAALGLTGCSHPASPTYQGYAEGEFVYLSSSQPGTLTQLSVARGQRVGAGTALFALDPVPEAAALRQAQQQLAAARARLADLGTGRRPPEIRVAQAQLAAAQADAHKAALQLTRDQQQYRAGGIARAQLDDSRADAAARDARVRELTGQLAVARLPARSQQRQAQTAQVAAAEAAVAQAQWQLDQTRVAAPAAGLVYDTLYRPGEWVQAGSPVVQLLPPANLKVRFFVPETVVGGLAPGRAVTVHCDGCAADVPARISYIATQAEYTPPVIYSNQSRSKLVFLVEARPAAADAVRLHPGQPVSVTLR